MRFFILGFFLLAACTAQHEDCENSSFVGDYLTSQSVGIEEPPPRVQKQVEFFNSCAEIIDHALEAEELFRRYAHVGGYGSYDAKCSVFPEFSTTDGIQADSGGEMNQPTNTQEKGVDEADRVKLSNRYIFYARETSIAVLDRNTKEFVQSIPVTGHWRPYIYVYNETLVVIRSHERPFIADDKKNSDVADLARPVFVRSPEKFDVVFFDVQREVKEIGRKTVVGRYKDSRLSSEGLLTVITGIDLARGRDRNNDRKFMEELLSHVDCSQVAKPGVTDYDHNLTSVNSFNVAQLKPAQAHKQTHLVGAYETIYQNQDLILTKNRIHWFWWDDRNTLDLYTNLAVRLEEKQDKWQVHSRFEFQGGILGPWSFSEQGGYLFVATTNNPEPGGRTTHLEIFKKTEKDTLRIGAVTGIAPDETLRSARFTEDYAYIVTFREWDPLFIIDIKNPEAPHIVSELKIPGFSSYLHNTNDGRLLGVGYQNWNLQLSLFDVGDPEAPLTLDQVVISGSSSSSAQTEHHAFFYEDDWELMGLPVRINGYGGDWSETLRFTGAHFYNISNDKITETAKVSHADWVQTHCKAYREWDGVSYWIRVPGEKDVARVHNIDGALMTFSDFGARVHDENNPNLELGRTLFEKPEDSCPLPYAVCSVID